MQSYIIETFHSLKSTKHSFHITNKMGEHIGFLQPIQFNYKETMPYLPKLLGNWRRANPLLSASIFDITIENTTNWLDNVVLGKKDRLLCMVNTLTGNHIGHMGFDSFNYTEQSAEIDCVLRGEASPTPDFMANALRCLLKYGHDCLYLKDIYLSTLQENEKAIHLYKKCGFIIIGTIPLFRNEKKNEVRWDADDTKDPALAEKWCVKMHYVGE